MAETLRYVHSNGHTLQETQRQTAGSRRTRDIRIRMAIGAGARSPSATSG